MTEAFAWILRAYGRELICRGRTGEELGRGMAVVQPMTKADWQFTAGALGSYRADRFLCLATPELPLNDMNGGSVEWDGKRYEIMTIRPVWVGGVTTHLWMALRPLEEMGA